MPTVSMKEKSLVYVRAYSTRQSAVAERVTGFPQAGAGWSRVRLITDWYDWDAVPANAGPPPRAGEVLQVEAFRLEAIRQ